MGKSKKVQVLFLWLKQGFDDEVSEDYLATIVPAEWHWTGRFSQYFMLVS